jgi:hypothetical protein
MQVGPMVRTWTIRYEAKRNFFKQCSRLANFMNISLSLSNRHQRWICYELASQNLLTSNMECGPSSLTTLLKEETQEFQAVLQEHINVNLETTITRPSWIKYFGVLYNPSNAFAFKSSDGLDPILAQMLSVIVTGSDYPFLEILLCTTVYYDDHLLSYAINVTQNRELLQTSQLYDRLTMI